MRRSFFVLLLAGLAGCPPTPAPTPATPCALTDAEWATILTGHSVARVWDELALHAVRRNLPAPTVHARTLFHTSAAMYDAWAVYDASAKGLFVTEKQTASDVEAARAEAISRAAYLVLSERYGASINGAEVSQCFQDGLSKLGYSPSDTGTTGDTPGAVGNRIGRAIILAGLDDGSNENALYADTTSWYPQNNPLIVAQLGNSMLQPDLWQPLQLGQVITQNGLAQDGGVQQYVGAQWREVTPFAMTRPQPGALYHDAGVAPSIEAAEMAGWLTEVARKQAQLEVTSDTIDISPGAYGNNPVGSNDGHGHPLNPITNAPYAPNVVPLGDFGRVMAEFWADGPNSETPPGHWNVMANAVADSPGFTRAWKGDAAHQLGALEWDVKLYLTLNGALHDAAITAWEIKRATTTSRPISLLRWYGTVHGQSSNPLGPSYDAQGLPEVPGLLEIITTESSLPGARHQALSGYVGKFAVRAWLGQPVDPANQVAGVDWRLLEAWVPYQKSTFVTPSFPGFISGHSTFSRAAAEVLAACTGSDYFPGGLYSFTAPAHQYLTFEDGPSVPVVLQWATYFDAADQAGQSRLWGGIHLQPDDFHGRELGQLVGRQAVAKVEGLFAP